MCVYDGEGWWEMYGEMCVEANRVDVEQRDEGGACVVGEFGKEFRADGGGRDD